MSLSIASIPTLIARVVPLRRPWLSPLGLPLLSLFPALGVAQSEMEVPSLLPPYGELPPTFWEQHGNLVLTASVAGLVLLALIVWLILRPRPTVAAPPAVQARQALTALRSLPVDGAGLSRVAQILRRYFITAFGLPPGEYTTSEFARLLHHHAPVGSALATAVSDYLRQNDEQKFARAHKDDLDRAVAQALELVEQAEARRAQLPPLAETPNPARVNP